MMREPLTLGKKKIANEIDKQICVSGESLDSIVDLRLKL